MGIDGLVQVYIKRILHILMMTYGFGLTFKTEILAMLEGLAMGCELGVSNILEEMDLTTTLF